jgi:drug/metabolite transporter (DMT)-like permease
MTVSRALEQTAVGSLQHAASSWLDVGVAFVAIGLMSFVSPRFTYRIRGFGRGPNAPRRTMDEMIARRRWGGAVMAVVGVVFIVLGAVIR